MVVFITPGPPEIYRARDGFITTSIARGPSGHESAILSKDPDDQSATFDISIWLHRCGLTCIGGGTFMASESSGQCTDFETTIVWHAMGGALCIIMNGDVFFVRITWVDKINMVPIVFYDVLNIHDKGNLSEQSSHYFAGDQVAVKLTCKSRHSVDATAICIADHGRYLMVTTKRGLILRYSWTGVKLSQIATFNSHDILNTWQGRASFALIKAHHVLHSRSTAEEDNTTSSRNSLTKAVTVYGAGVDQETLTRSTMEGSALDSGCASSDGNMVRSCGYCSSLQIHHFIWSDGSVSFLQDVGILHEDLKRHESHAASGYRCSSMISPVMLLKPDTSTSNKTSNRKSYHVLNHSGHSNVDRNMRQADDDVASSRITCAHFMTSDTPSTSSSARCGVGYTDSFSEDKSSLLVMTVLTHHSLEEDMKRAASAGHAQQKVNGKSIHNNSSSSSSSGGGGNTAYQRVTLSLLLVQITVQSVPLPVDAIQLETVSVVTLESSRCAVPLTRCAGADDTHSNSHSRSRSNSSIGHAGLHSASSSYTHSVTALHRPGYASDLVLVIVRGVVSCRLLESLGTELFRIDGHSYICGIGTTVNSISSSCGRLIVAVTSHTGGSMESSATRRSKIHVIPLLECAQGSVVSKGCGDILMDLAENRLLQLRTPWNQSLGSSMKGHYSEILLPFGLIQEWKARLLYLSVRSARGKIEGGGGMLVASSSADEATGGHSVCEIMSSTRSTAGSYGSASAGKGYLAVVVAGTTAAASEPCLWLYNCHTGRWRNSDISSKDDLKLEDVKPAYSPVPRTRRSSADMESGLWVDVGSKLNVAVPLLMDALNSQNSCDSDSSNTGKFESRGMRSSSHQVRSPSITSVSTPTHIGSVAAASAATGTGAIGSSVVGISWFSEHSLLLLRSREGKAMGLGSGSGGGGGGAGSGRSTLSSAYSFMTLEIFSRASTKESLRTGRPVPAVHKAVPLPPCMLPNFASCTRESSGPSYFMEVCHVDDEDGAGRCVVVVCNGYSCASFIIEAAFLAASTSSEATVSDYHIYALWSGRLAELRGNSVGNLSSLFPVVDSDTDSRHAAGSEAARMSLPIVSLSILPTKAYSLPMVVLDGQGAAWKVDMDACALIAKGPFKAISNFNFNSIFSENKKSTGEQIRGRNGSDIREGRKSYDGRNSSSNSPKIRGSYQSVRSADKDRDRDRDQMRDDALEACLLLESSQTSTSTSSRGSGGPMGEDYLWLSTSSGALIDESPPMTLLIPMSSVPRQHAPLVEPGPRAVLGTVGVVKGVLLTIQRSAVPLSLTSSSTENSRLTSCAIRDILVSQAGGITVQGRSVAFEIFKELLEVSAGRQDSAIDATEAVKHTVVSLLKRLLSALQSPLHSPFALRLFVESAELHIKSLLESSIFFRLNRPSSGNGISSGSRNNRWVRSNTPPPLPFPSSSSPARRRGTGATGQERYSEIMSALYYCSSSPYSIFCELITRLGRKLEPALSCRLFPVPLDPKLCADVMHLTRNKHSSSHAPDGTAPAQDPTPAVPRIPHSPSPSASPSASASVPALPSSATVTPQSGGRVATPMNGHSHSPAPTPTSARPPTPLCVFEHTLSTRQLHRACRMLTLACEYAGGTDTSASASLCLGMALELLYECIRHLSLSLAVQCFDFCHRLESMIVTINMGPLPGVFTRPPSRSASSTAEPGAVEVFEPEGLIGGHRRLERNPEMRVACGGNGMWRGMGGGVFSSLASVSPALSYYIGGTMIWAVTQTIRLLSDAPAHPRTSSSSASSSTSAAHGNDSSQTELHSTYNYTTLPALSQSGGGGRGPGNGKVKRSDESPSMALISLICSDLISSGKFYCCSVIIAALQCGSSASTFRLLFRHKLHGMLLPDKAASASAPASAPASASAANGHSDHNENGNDRVHDLDPTPTMQRQEQEQEQEQGKLTAMAVARAFRLQKLLPLEGKGTAHPSSSSSQLSAKLCQCLMGPYFRQKCEKEMVAIQQPTSSLQYNRGEAVGESELGEGGDVHAHSTTLVVTDVASSILSDAYTSSCTSRVLFLSAAEITAQAMGRRDSLDETHQLELDQSVTSLLLSRASYTGGVRSSARVLPQALHAVSNVDITSLLSGSTAMKTPALYMEAGEKMGDTDAESEYPDTNPGSSSLRILVHSLCVALLLIGDIEGAGAVTSLILQRPDISSLCSALNRSSRSILRSPASTATEAVSSTAVNATASATVTATATATASSSELRRDESLQSQLDLDAAFEIIYRYFVGDDG